MGRKPVAEQLFDDVRAFTVRFKAKPPRSTKLGWDLYMALKRRISSPLQTELRELVSQLSTIHMSSIKCIGRLECEMRRRAAKHCPSARVPVPRRPLPKHLNKFATNQRRKGSRCPLSAVLARPVGKPRTSCVKLDPVNVMNNKDGFQQTPQAVVDLLYTMLAYWIAVSRTLSLQWCVTWGTLLGCYRGQAMLGHDYDVDVTVFVDNADEFWSDTFPQLVLYFESRGFRFVRANKRYAKVIAGDCGKSDDWFELKAASARDCSDRSAIVRDASSMQRSGKKVNAQTPHVLDILVAATPNFFEGPHLMSKCALLPFTMKPFASLCVPTPAHSARVLAHWFGPCWKTDKYFKDPITHKMWPVPRGAQTNSWPSLTVAERLNTIVTQL